MGDIRDRRNTDEIMSSLIHQMVRDDASAVAAVNAAYHAVKGVYEEQPNYPYPVLDKDGKRTGETEEIPFLQFRVNMAGILAENVKAGADLVVASLIGPAYKLHLLSNSVLESAVGTGLFTSMQSILKSVSNLPEKKQYVVPRIDDVLFGIAINECYEAIRKSLTYNSQLIYISNAYKMAQEAHENVYRQSGEPYIVHPLMVARMLAEKGFESEVVAAALLHDVVEDSNFTVEDINRRLSVRIGAYVESVTAVRRSFETAEAEYKQASGDLSPEEKQELDRETASKLIAAAAHDESMVYAICIKAADRLHNLRTIDGMSQEKIRNKLEETERLYLPIFKAFNANYFVDAIENEIWRAASLDNGYYITVKERYEQLTSENAAAIRSLDRLLRVLVIGEVYDLCKSSGLGDFKVNVETEYFYPYQVYSTVRDRTLEIQHKKAHFEGQNEYFARFSNMNSQNLEQYITKQNTPLVRFNLLVDGAKRTADIKNFTLLFMKVLVSIAEDQDISIITAVEEKENKRICIVLEDRFNCQVHVYIYLQEEYYRYNFGDNHGFVISADSKLDAIDAVRDGVMHVFSKDDEVFELPVGSTVLDFAFRVHEEICMFAQRASINGSAFTEENLFRTLYPGDRVTIEHNAENLGDNKYTQASVRINWLNHVKTDAARKQITRWLQRRYEGTTQSE